MIRIMHVRQATQLLVAVGIELFPALESVMKLARRILGVPDEADRLLAM